ncbi:MAG TPA: hypothetical protein VN131_05510 [Mobilitalea sp.]|nr:hypothetical protein [Mobilitalea sp.]
MEIYLIRHGERQDYSLEYYNEEKEIMDSPLTEKGMESTYP